MNPISFEELEEGEIADDIVPEPIVQKKIKALPRRYILNEGKAISKHKKNCKHSAQHHKQKNKCDFPTNSKLHKKHRKACPKHCVDRHVKLSIKKSSVKDRPLKIGLNNNQLQYGYPKVSFTKSAFKNYMSPPRTVVKVGNSNNITRSPSQDSDSYPKLLSEYKKSRNDLKFKNISNFKERTKLPFKASDTVSDSVVPKQNSSENLPLVQKLKLNSDDEDEEELRRIALATCAKRTNAVQDATEENSCETKSSSSDCVVISDNYEIVDMEVDNETDNLEKVDDDLFIIDTTPSIFCELDQQCSSASFDPNFNVDGINSSLPTNGFLPSLNIEEPFQTFESNVFGQNVNNDLYESNFGPIVNESNLPSSHLDDDFEEELLRAELIANLNIMRGKTENVKKVSIPDVAINTECKASKNESFFKEERTISFKKGKNECEVSENDPIFKEERTISLINDTSKNENAFKERTVSVAKGYSKPDLINMNSVMRKRADIKVKLNNLNLPNANTCAPSNIITLPQERIIISLNNDSSSDESDHEKSIQIEQPMKSAPIASLEALISNARHESDGKIDSVSGSTVKSDAISWLSKAQQEQYNSLKKILDKQQPGLKSSQNEVKHTADNPNLLLLKKKMFIANKNLEKEKELINHTTKDLVKKKRAYMVSKLRTQHLKEQLLAAERVRKSNLQLWTKCSSELQILKKSVSKRQVIINSLQKRINSLFPEYSANGLSLLSSHISDSDINILL